MDHGSAVVPCTAVRLKSYQILNLTFHAAWVLFRFGYKRRRNAWVLLELTDPTGTNGYYRVLPDDTISKRSPDDLQNLNQSRAVHIRALRAFLHSTDIYASSCVY
eukprot:1333929-Amorphochlora_amoeboformis.AAC.1